MTDLYEMSHVKYLTGYAKGELKPLIDEKGIQVLTGHMGTEFIEQRNLIEIIKMIEGRN
jgi:hypothetical protein